MNLVYRVIPNYPREGVNFIDMAEVYRTQLTNIVKELKENIFKCDAILGIESRGFITASALASELNLPLILVRKEAGSLPNYIRTKEFNNEYATRKFCLPPTIINYRKVVIVDDLIATGNTINNLIASLKELGISTSQVLSTVLLRDLNPRINAPLYYIKEISCKDI